MTKQHYNLVDEPWIRVLDDSGLTRDVSLRELFHQSPNLISITGELPTQDIAILRLALAVLHRAIEGPKDIDEWAELRADWDLAIEKVDAYLDEYFDGFWMQHPTHPFMQVADLRTAKNEVFELARIICDGPGGAAFLTTRLGENLETLTWAEATRWLLHSHAYDVSGIKSGAVGDARVKGGKGYPIGTGWLGQIGVMHLVGETLKETLLLNLIVPAAAEMEIAVEADLPIWERSPLTASPDGWDESGGANQDYRQPTGPVDLYTWPARRIRLTGAEDLVTAVVVAQGDRATPQNRQAVEPMSAWRYSEPQTKKFGTDVYMPQKHDSTKALWRGLEALLPKTSGRGKGGQTLKLPPAMANWVEALREDEHLPDPLLKWRAVGLDYGSNESVFDELIADEIVLPTAAFGNQDFAEQVVAAADAADQAVYALGTLAQNVALASGAASDSSGPRERIAVHAFAALDPMFRGWVRELASEVDIAEARAKWHRTVAMQMSRLANEIVAEAGPTALVGRTTGGQFRDAGLALHWFRKALRKAVPYAYVSSDSGGLTVENLKDSEGAQ